ncbi:MAG: LacI family DNA-binding transcriptional regulator [Candidatus Ventricola sp.]|nr:LacI family DNA-binding transcriptional regulator [Candidatus Ventricola sp.]
MAVTIKELSAHCGLSVSTVSKALNGYPDVSEETKALVRAAAQELGYHPNAIARGLKLGRSFSLGVLYEPDAGGFTHNFFSPVLEAFKAEAERRGYDITFVTHDIGRTPMTYLEHCRYRNVDGVCIVCADFERDEVRELVSGELPVVTIDHVFNNRTCIQSDNRQGMAELTRYILSMGHRRIAYICGQASAVTTQRKTTFLRTMGEAGLSVPDEYLIEACYHDPAAAREATLRLLAADPRPTCILMPDDYASLGGREAILAAGLRIPEDVSVAGYDGVQLIQLCQPRLTTIWQDTCRIGQEAARQLVHLIEQPRTTCPEILPIACRLLQGETICKL